MRSIPSSRISSIRNELFLEAKEAGLATAGDALVTRRKTNGGRTVKGKHASDVCLLVSSIKNKTTIPRTLLRNGKRSKDELTASQARHLNAPDLTDPNPFQDTAGSVPELMPNLGSSSTEDATAGAFRSTIVSNISSLMSSVDSLKEEVQVFKGKLNRDSRAVDDCSTCLIYVRLKNSTTNLLTDALLKSRLQTEILAYDIIRAKPTPVFRVKIAKTLLYNGLTHARAHDCVADLWGGSHSPFYQIPVGVPRTTNHTSTAQQSLIISCWNCRGWTTGVSYLDHMALEGSDVMIISEHWLWPFELHKLDEFNDQYRGIGKADPRLSETSDTCTRGCGGVGILWRKSLEGVLISDIQSDRIYGIRMKRSIEEDQSWISILGVYLPCLDLGIDLYRETLVELERVVSELEQAGPVIIAGDFNAHLGPKWGARAHRSQNVQGVLLGEVLDRCKLHATSLGETVSGPDYTFRSGNSSTIVNYIMADVEASSCVESCKVLEDTDLNTSDHLALSVTLVSHANSV